MDQNIEKENNENEDDGSLAFLKLPRDENDKLLLGDVTSQQKLVNTTFWIQDFIEGVSTKYSRMNGNNNGQTIVQISSTRDGKEGVKKFFTGSYSIISKLKQVKELGKFPRRVTLRSNGRSFYIE